MKKKTKKIVKKKRTKAETEVLRTQEIQDARHRPTDETRREVTSARLALMCDEDLSASLGISVARLHECYKYELVRGPAEARRKLISSMYAEAMAGKPAAVKQLEAMTNGPLHTELSLSRKEADVLRGAVVGVQELTGKNEEDNPRSPKYVGKKERAALEAKKAYRGSSFGSVLNDEEDESTLQ